MQITFGRFWLKRRSCLSIVSILIQWHHNERNGISNHQHLNCSLNHLLRRRSKKTSKLRVTGLCEGKSLVTGEFPSQRVCNMENDSIWWCHHAFDWVANMIFNRLAVTWQGVSMVFRWPALFSANLTHWGRDKMTTTFQMTFQVDFLPWKCFDFKLRFHCNLIPMVYSSQ